MDSVVRSGSRPWLPNPEATELDVWHSDDVPVAGIFEMRGEKVLFNAIGGVDSDVTVWAYLPLTPTEYFELDEIEFDSVPSLFREIEGRFSGRRFVVAVADEFVLRQWTALDEPAASMWEAATRFLRDSVAAMRSETEFLKSRAAASMTASPRHPESITSQLAALRQPDYRRPVQPSGREEQLEDFLVSRDAAVRVLLTSN